MALSDLSFKFYTDSGLTSLFSGLYQLTHQTDLSDNPQDFTLYFGSNNSANQLEATSNPGVDEISLSPTDILPIWQASHAYTLGQMRQPVTPNGYIYKVSTAGTSNSSEPTWPTSGFGSTVVDGSVIWTLYGVHHDQDEITLALTEPDLGTNVAGDPLDIGPTILGGVVNAVEVWIRVENAVTRVESNTGYPEVGININEVVETAI